MGKKKGGSGGGAKDFWDGLQGWRQVQVGDDLLLGSDEYGFCGLEELDAGALGERGCREGAAASGGRRRERNERRRCLMRLHSHLAVHAAMHLSSLVSSLHRRQPDRPWRAGCRGVPGRRGGAAEEGQEAEAAR